MKLKVNFYKHYGDLRVVIVCVNASGYYTPDVFQHPKNGHFYHYIEKSFPLKQESFQEAEKWIEEIVYDLKQKVNYWRNFELPPERIIEF